MADDDTRLIVSLVAMNKAAEIAWKPENLCRCGPASKSDGNIAEAASRGTTPSVTGPEDPPAASKLRLTFDIKPKNL